MASDAATLLPLRDSLTALRAIPCALAFEGADRREPLVTVAIPTYRRGELLVEAVESVLRQDFVRPFEIVVIDNDPASTGVEALLDRVPALRTRAFRYYVNAENVGHCHNGNRCIQLARAPWVTILHDDDLHAPDFLTVSFREFDADPLIDGIVGAKGLLDQRAAPPAEMTASPGLAVRARRLARRGLTGALYRGRSSRRITVRKLFWGPVTGNVAGFVFRRSSAEAIGGFAPDEEPNADYWFYARFAQRFHLRQHRQQVATIRVSVNESANPATIAKMYGETHAFRQALAMGSVPRWWGRLSPYLVARSRVELRDFWGVDVPPEEVGRMIGQRLPADRPPLIWTLKFLLRGF